MGLQEQVLAAAAAHQVALLWGAPGIGKTAFACDLARRLGARLHVVCLAHEEAADIHGFKAVAKHRIPVGDRDVMVVESAPPAYATTAVTEPGLSMILYDEINNVSAGSQASVLRILGERVIADLQLDPHRVMLLACANPTEMAAGGWELSRPASNRMCHLKFPCDARGWVSQFPSYWGNPPALGFGRTAISEKNFAAARALVAGYIRRNPAALLDVPKTLSDDTVAWASPRSWAKVAGTWAYQLETGHLDPADVAALVAGHVGEGHGNTFLHWAETLDLVDAEALLADPRTFALPTTEDRQFHLVTAVTAHVAYLAALTRGKGGDAKARPLTKAADAARAAAFNVLGRFVRAGGPKDIATLGAIALSGDSHRVHKDDRHRSDPPPPTPAEIELFPDVLRAAGVTQGGR